MNGFCSRPINSYIRRLNRRQRLALCIAEFTLLMFLGWSLTLYA
jgi:uncharacterized protein YggL (DUF469 family)